MITKLLIGGLTFWVVSSCLLPALAQTDAPSGEQDMAAIAKKLNNPEGEVPVDRFWSISVYGADGFFHKNELDACSSNNVTAKKGAGGSVTIQFGGCHCQLYTEHAGLELLGAPLSTAKGNPRRHMEIPGGAGAMKPLF